MKIQKAYKTKILIIGGGLSGLALAAALNQRKIPYICVDRAPRKIQESYAFDGRTTALSASSKFFLEHIGVWKFARGYAGAMRQIRVAQEGGSAKLDYYSEALPYGPFGYVIENRYLRKAFHKKIASSHGGKCLYLGSETLCAIKEGKTSLIHAVFDSGMEIQAELLVGADGAHSVCRRFFGIEACHFSYNQSALITLLDHEKPHNEIAVELFRKEGPFALLPMQGNRSSVIWCERSEMADFYRRAENLPYAFEKIQNYCKDFLGKIQFAADLQAYPLGWMEAERYTAPRAALIGETIHRMHPIAGQGFNVSMRDIAVLTELLYDAFSKGEDFGSREILASYEQRRHFDVSQLLFVTDSLTKMLSTSSPFLKWMLGRAFEAVENVSWLRNFLMLDAMGLTGKLSYLLKPINKGVLS